VLYFSCHRFSFGNHESHLAVETSPGRSGRFAAARRAADGARASDFAGVERDLEGAATALGNVDGSGRCRCRNPGDQQQRAARHADDARQRRRAQRPAQGLRRSARRRPPQGHAGAARIGESAADQCRRRSGSDRAGECARQS